MPLNTSFPLFSFAGYVGRSVFLVVVEIMDFQGIFVDSFALGFGVATVASVVGIAIRYLKNIIRGVSDVSNDI